MEHVRSENIVKNRGVEMERMWTAFHRNQGYVIPMDEGRSTKLKGKADGIYTRSKEIIPVGSTLRRWNVYFLPLFFFLFLLLGSGEDTEASSATKLPLSRTLSSR